MTTATTTAPALPLAAPEPQTGLLKRWLGPDNYRIVRALVTNPLSVAGIFLLGLFVLLALLAPVLAPPVGSDGYQIPRDGFKSEPQPPGTVWRVRPPEVPAWYRAVTGREEWVHLFGTASGQWDIYYGVIWGIRTAFKVGLLISLTSLLIGVTIGSVAAYYGGFVDQILMRLTDVFLAFPFLVAALTLSALLTPLFGRGLYPAIIALIAFGWMGYARLIRGDILSVKEREFVTAARVIGARDSNILVRHIIPNAIFPTLVLASLDIGTQVLSFATLSFLGVGVEVGYADWGQLIAFARDWITALSTYWYIVAFPGGAIVLFVLGWNLIGDALRDVFDPRMRGRGGA